MQTFRQSIHGLAKVVVRKMKKQKLRYKFKSVYFLSPTSERFGGRGFQRLFDHLALFEALYIHTTHFSVLSVDGELL